MRHASVVQECGPLVLVIPVEAACIALYVEFACRQRKLLLAQDCLVNGQGLLWEGASREGIFRPGSVSTI